MPERLPFIFKCVCALLIVLVLYQLTRLFRIGDPLEGVTLPDLAILTANSEASEAQPESEPAPENSIPPGMPPRFRRGRGPTPQLPSEIQNQVDTIQQSEILGRLPRPQPLMLLGIAGHHAFLQTPMGQAGLATEGEEVGGVKVIRIGTNRVLVEVEGKPQELVLFPGLPGESLMSNTHPPQP